MCCPSNEVVRSVLALGALQEDKLCVTLQATRTRSNGLSNLLIPYREQPRSTRIMFAYTRPAFPVTKQTQYAPISFSRATSIPRFMMVETLSCCSWRASQPPAVQSLVLPTKGPCILVSRRGISRPTQRRSAHLPFPERLWCLLTGSASPIAITVENDLVC